MTFPCPYCRKLVHVGDSAILAEAGAISSARRKSHGAGSGRPRGYRKCPKCGKLHQPEEMRKCKAGN